MIFARCIQRVTSKVKRHHGEWCVLELLEKPSGSVLWGNKMRKNLFKEESAPIQFAAAKVQSTKRGFRAVDLQKLRVGEKSCDAWIRDTKSLNP